MVEGVTKRQVDASVGDAVEPNYRVDRRQSSLYVGLVQICVLHCIEAYCSDIDGSVSVIDVAEIVTQ